MKKERVRLSSLAKGKKVEFISGIFRTTLAYNDNIMLCYFTLKKGASIPLHTHVADQIGFVLKGKIKFLRKDGESFIVTPGDSYVFDSEEYHGSEILEDSEIIECFTPMRPEYADA